MKIRIKDEAVHISLDGVHVHKYAPGTVIEAASAHQKNVLRSLVASGKAVDAGDEAKTDAGDAVKVRKPKERK